MLEFEVLDLLFLHALHQSGQELLLVLMMFARQRVLLGRLSSYHVRPLQCLLVYQRSNLIHANMTTL